MASSILREFEEFIEANKPQKVTSFNYLRFLYMNEKITSDFILLLNNLWSPEFIIVNNQVYLKELFEIRKDKIALNSDNAQLWINLLEVSDLFFKLSIDEVLHLSKSLVESWNAKILLEFPNSTDRAKLLYEQKDNEVYITIVKQD